VTSNNGCATSVARTLTISKSTAAPGVITGPKSGLCALGTATYSIAAVSGATSYNWYTPAGMLITSGGGTTRITVNITSSLTTGTLKVNAQNNCGVSTSSSLSVSCASPVAMDGQQETVQNSILLYPNPTSNEFMIDISSDFDREVLVEVYDLPGNLFKQEKHLLLSGTSTIKTNIEENKSGIYFVRITDKDNNVLYTQRVIKQ
jgi:hypothetical protein